MKIFRLLNFYLALIICAAIPVSLLATLSSYLLRLKISPEAANGISLGSALALIVMYVVGYTRNRALLSSNIWSKPGINAPHLLLACGNICLSLAIFMLFAMLGAGSASGVVFAPLFILMVYFYEKGFSSFAAASGNLTSDKGPTSAGRT